MRHFQDSRRHLCVKLCARKSDGKFPLIGRGRKIAAVALGIGVNKDQTGPSKASEANALTAGLLFWRNFADLIVLVGWGQSHPKLPEWKAMRMAIRDFVPATAIVEEKQSYTTYMNAVNTLQILKELGVTHAYIIAEALHARRVAATFRHVFRDSTIQLSIQVTYGDYEPKRWNWPNTPWFFFYYEILAFVFFWLMGYIARNPLQLRRDWQVRRSPA